MTFPANVISLAVSAGSNFLNTMFGGSIAHSTGINLMLSNLIATQKRLGTGSQTAPARGLALIGTGTADGDGNQGSIWDRNERKNLIVNGSGRTKQRSTLPTADNSYAIDRMRLLMENATGWTITQEVTTLPTAPGATTGFRFTIGGGTAGKGGGFWPVVFADMAEVAGGVLSLQANIYISNARLTNMRMGIAQFTGTADAISGDPVSAWGADGTNPTLAANWSFADTPASLALSATTFGAKYSQNVAISASAKNVAVLVWCDGKSSLVSGNGDFFIVTDIDMERGAVCTAVERISEPLERAACRDWLEKLGGVSGQYFGAGQAVSTTFGTYTVPFSPKRAVPGSITSGTTGTDFDVTAANGSAVQPTAGGISIGATCLTSMNVTVTTSAGLTRAGDGSQLLAHNASAFFLVSAEP